MLTGAVSLLAIIENSHPVRAAVPAGLELTLGLVQAMGDTEVEIPLWCVTRGAVTTGRADQVDHPVQAMVWGLGPVVRFAHPQRWGGLVDLPESLDEHLGARLCGVLAGIEGEDQIALRSSGVFARRLVPVPLGESPGIRQWVPRGTTLVTGGTGALGAHVARWLAHRGAEHLLLVSRRGPDAPGARALTTELVELGARVSVVACDLGRRRGAG